MEELTSWRGHSFTLLIFGGIVVLCSIFFILGMLVGRTQLSPLGGAPETTQAAVSDEADAVAGTDPENLDLTFYEAVEDETPEPLEEAPAPEPEAPEPEAAEPETPPAPATPPPATDVTRAISLQIAALSNAEQAERLRQEVESKGFPAFVLRPAPEDASRLHRVQVGPFSDPAEVTRVRRQLESEGYRPIVRN